MDVRFANAAYALLSYWYETSTKLVEADNFLLEESAHRSAGTIDSEQSADDADPPAPLSILWECYAPGEIDERKFERRVERLLETDRSRQPNANTSARNAPHLALRALSIRESIRSETVHTG